MKEILISREKECRLLQHSLESDRSELIVVSGRRRIGKTYLIDTFFKRKYDFTFVGEHDTPTKRQIQNFMRALQKQSGRKQPSVRDWYDAFNALEDYLESISGNRKKIIFIDEMPWMDARRSSFVRALENFWNGWANRRKDIVLIATGSSTSWMADKLLGNKGGLHARVTCNLHLSPFSLHDTEAYLRSVKCKWDRYQVLQCYMTFGGIPFYLSLLNPKQSLAENIDRLFFSPDSQLKNEFDELYTALFPEAESYTNIVKLLSENKCGLNREEISKATGLEGSYLTQVIKNLMRSDFVTLYNHYDCKKRAAVYKLTDFFTLFYYKFGAMFDSKNPKWWSQNLRSQSVLSWMGLSFELVCLCHPMQIKESLGIAGINSEFYTWKSNANPQKHIPGFQIDMIIKRADRVIHLCEMKFSTQAYRVDGKYEEELRKRMAYFDIATGNKMTLLNTFVTTYGIVGSKYASIVDCEVTMDGLFKS